MIYSQEPFGWVKSKDRLPEPGLEVLCYVETPREKPTVEIFKLGEDLSSPPPNRPAYWHGMFAVPFDEITYWSYIPLPK